jgi:predicted molibdopterin-dependent oxidoreductase YjgC
MGNRRIIEHPILGPLPEAEECSIIVDTRPIKARIGEPILSALIAAGIDTTRTTEKFDKPRGLFCGIGLCTDCLVTVDGTPNIRSCITPVEEGMVIETDTREAQSSG